MKDIKNIRSEIDSIDSELVNLFRRRLEIVAEVAASKHERGAPVTDPARERDILARVTEEVGEEYAYGARLFFSTLFGISKARQRALLNGESELVKTIRGAMADRTRSPSAARSFRHIRRSRSFQDPTPQWPQRRWQIADGGIWA